jgi:hypothetical protein
MNTISTQLCIIGLGPAGLGAALSVARSRSIPNTICLEAGVDVKLKFCTILEGKGCRRAEPCQIISGVGGASVLSGGKISAFPAGRALNNIIGTESQTQQSLQAALNLFTEFVPLIPPTVTASLKQQASSQFSQKGFDFRYYDAYRYKPTDLIAGYDRMLQQILAAGISVRLGTWVTQITDTEDGYYVVANTDDGEIQIFTERLIIATGRMGMNLLTNINTSLELEGSQNHCDVGVRLEFPTSVWPDIDYCHHDLKLHFGQARTFCVCKDGYIAPYRHKDIFLLEGSDSPDVSTGFTNLAITIRVPPNNSLTEQTLLEEVQTRLLAQSGGKPVRQQLLDFLARKPSPTKQKEKGLDPASITYWRWGDVAACFPDDIASNIHQAVEYFVTRLLPENALSKVSVFAPELDYYWLKFPLYQGFRSRRSGLYLIGDCTGHFRGILQAFCSGIVCGDDVLGTIYV